MHICVCMCVYVIRYEKARDQPQVSFFSYHSSCFIVTCLLIFILSIWLICLHICLYTDQRGQERTSDLLNWVRAGCQAPCGSRNNGTRVLYKISKCSLNLWAISTALPSRFLRQGLSLAWSLAIRLSWLISEPQRSSCLCLPSAVITNTLHYTWLIYVNSLKSNSGPLQLKYFIDWTIPPVWK